jgi:hypothetical protein
MSQDQATTPAEYEFTDGQNVTIRALAGAMKFVAVFEVILGIFYGLLTALSFLGGVLVNAIIYGVTSVITIVLAMMVNRAAGYFRSVVDSKGSDIMLLMGALEHLRGYFNTKRILYIIALCVGVLAFVLGILLFTARSASPTAM